MIKFVFENIWQKQNFVQNKDVVPSGQKRFTPSPMATCLGGINTDKVEFERLTRRSNRYIFATGVNHSPNDWTGYKRTDLDHLFACIPDKVYKDMRRGKAMLLIDQSLEGYHTDWLFDFFHTACVTYRLNPRQIIYVSGNMLLEEQYKNYCASKGIKNKMHTFGYPHFEEDMLYLSEQLNLDVGYKQALRYKKKNKKNIATYCLLQKRMRPHRPWFFSLLAKENLLDKGLINMDSFQGPIWLDGEPMPQSLIDQAQAHLPMWIDEPNNENPDSFYIRRITKDYFDKSWFSIVSEASFQEQENTLFISEKTFKPIICHQPFMILGSKGSMAQLQDMGYKTFDPYIDESYDKLDSFDRMNAMVDTIKKIDAVGDKLYWFQCMQDIIEHNYETLIKNAKGYNKYIHKLNIAYKEYFG